MAGVPRTMPRRGDAGHACVRTGTSGRFGRAPPAPALVTAGGEYPSRNTPVGRAPRSRRMRWQLTLTRQLLLFQLGIVLLVVAAVAAVSLAGSAAAFRCEEGGRLRSIAANLAANETVRQGVGDPVWQEPLAGVAETARSVSGSSFVVLTDAGGTFITGPD